MPITYGVPTCDLANMIKWVTRPGTGGNLINIEPTDYDAEQDKDKDLVILPHDTWGYLLNYWHKDLTETDRKELWVSRDALIPVSEALQEKGVKTMIVKQGNRILDGWYKSDSINKDPVSIPDMRDIVE